MSRVAPATRVGSRTFAVWRNGQTVEGDAAVPPSATVAVITRTKDRPAFLARAADSVGTQRFKDLIWVIVNDGGDPTPVEAAAGQASARGLAVVVLHLETSSGMEAASNTGVRAVRSDYVALHDDDDAWHTDFLAKTVDKLEHHTRYVGAISHTLEIHEDWRNGTPRELKRRAFQPCPPVIYLADLFVGNLFPPISLLFRRRAYESTGGFDETFPVLGDWEFNLRLALEGDIAVIPEPLAYYYVRPKSPDGDPAANTVTARMDHLEQDARFRNALLRKAVRDGRVDEGLLVSFHRLSYTRKLVQLGPRVVFKRASNWLLRRGPRL
ncbi:MAG: glycosyltransferase [Thermoanaerobaculia bacterium]